MPSVPRYKTLAFSMFVLLAAQAVAGDESRRAQSPHSPHSPHSPYQLKLGNASAFRLDAENHEYISRSVPERLAGKPYAVQIQRAARRATVDPLLVHAVIAVESGYNPAARSPKGAIGLMQIMPQTALRYGVRDPGRSTDANLRIGTRYLSDLLDLFDGRLDLALAAYNAGENAVIRHDLSVPPYLETTHYVRAVAARYRALRGGEGPSPVLGRKDYLSGTRLSPATRRAFATSARLR